MTIHTASERVPTHPGTILLTEFFEPLGMPQKRFAERIGVPVQRVNEIVKGKRRVTANSALRFAKALGTSPGFWLNLQQRWSLYQVMQDIAPEIERTEPIRRVA